MSRLPGGEYREQGERDRSVWELREYFLQKVADLTPEVLEDLQAEVLPVFRTAYEATKKPPKDAEPASDFGGVVPHEQWPEWLRWRFRDGDWDPDGTDWPEELLAFHSQLLTWAGNCYLREHWVLDTALRTVIFWFFRDSSPGSDLERLHQWKTLYSPDAVEHVFKDQGRNIEESLEVFPAWKEWEESPTLRFLPLRFSDAFRTPRFTFEYEGWVPRKRLWREYERDLRDAFEEELTSYETGRRGRAEERGLDAPREVRKPVHFEWLVLFQVRGMSYLKIAEKYDVRTSETPTGRTSSTVGEAVRDKAARIRLTLRKK